MEAKVGNNQDPLLHKLAEAYAQTHFPITADGQGEAIKHDVAFHSFCDGFNALLRFGMSMRNLEDPCQDQFNKDIIDSVIKL